MSNIDTLVADIKNLLYNGRKGSGRKIDDKDLADLGASIAIKVQKALTRREGKRPPKTIYMSEIGFKCLRKLWYEIHKEDLKLVEEDLPASAVLKFLYGDVIEELVLFLARQAGHKVEDEQKLVEIELPRGWKLRGKMDARIDGEIVDVKSTSSHSFYKFTQGLDSTNDRLGYIEQLTAYNVGEGVAPGSTTSFLAIDKQNGTITRDVHKVPDVIVEDIEESLTALEHDKPPIRGFGPKATTGGNEELEMECSYCKWKFECWKDANDGKGIRTFVYSNRPKFLVKVATTPRVPEIKSD